jgi:PTS system nitrogen regulatory IIA component
VLPLFKRLWLAFAMNSLAPYVTIETVRLDLNVASRKRLFEEAGLVFESSAGIPHKEAFDALFAREKLGSTCIGGGCAIPHGRTEHAEEPAVAVIRTAEPIVLDAPDGKPVQLFICMLVPQKAAEQEEVREEEEASEDSGEKDGAAAQDGEKPCCDCSRLFLEADALLRDKGVRAALLAAKTDVEVCEIIHGWEPPSGLSEEEEAEAEDESVSGAEAGGESSEEKGSEGA